MKNTVLEALQKKEFEMLCQVKELFEKNDIPFFLAYGTALGCVRHGGFIPWDDDIDIHVYGADYERIMNVFKTQDTGDLALHDWNTVNNYPYSFPKIVSKNSTLVENSAKHIDYKCGVYIDIFPLYGLNGSPIKRAIESKWLYFNYCFIRARYNKFGFWNRISKIVNIKTMQRRIQKISNNNPCDYTYCSDTTLYSHKNHFDSKIVSSTKSMDFNGVSMPLPQDYDAYLKHLYGDYMTLPPEENRVPIHNFCFLEIDGKKLIEKQS